MGHRRQSFLPPFFEKNLESQNEITTACTKR
jgi:hypothetical protein